MVAGTIEAAMTREVYAVGADTSLEAAARLFSTRHVSGAPVLDESGRAVGVITLHDLCDPERRRSEVIGRARCYRVVAGMPEEIDGGQVASSGVCGDVMTSFVVAVARDLTVEAAVKLMVTDGIHRLFVVEQQRVLGVVTSMDIMKVLAKR